LLVEADELAEEAEEEAVEEDEAYRVGGGLEVLEEVEEEEYLDIVGLEVEELFDLSPVFLLESFNSSS